MILDNSHIRVVIVADILVDLLLWHLNEHDIRYTVPNLEAAKLELGPVVSQFAEESVSRQHERLHVFSRTSLGIRMRLWRLIIVLLSYV